jgi:hypothetical protein
MNESKALYLEGIIILLFIWTISSVFAAVIGVISIIWGIALASIFGITYVSFLAWYASIKVENKHLKEYNSHIKRLIIGHSLVLLIPILAFDLITKFIILATILIGAGIISSAFHNIEESERDHIHFKVKTIIMPHTRPIIIWLMIITAVLIYGNTLKTNPNGIVLDESFIAGQVEAWSPLLKQVAPGLNIEGSVGNYVEGQIKEQSLGANVTNQDQEVKKQVSGLSEKFGILLSPDTPISQAFVSYANKFLEPWMSGPIWGAIVSFAVYLTLAPFVGFYQVGIRWAIMYIHRQSLERNILNLYLKSLNKERYRL